MLTPSRPKIYQVFIKFCFFTRACRIAHNTPCKVSWKITSACETFNSCQGTGLTNGCFPEVEAQCLANAHASFSGGQKSRVAFADLSLSNPDVIVLVGIRLGCWFIIHKLGVLFLS